VSVGFLKEKSGSPTTLEKHFKSELREAFAELEKKLGWEAKWSNNKVTVSRTPTDTQKRHLANKAAAASRLKASRAAKSRQLALGGSSEALRDTPLGTRQALAALLNAR
jgi:hypothetical protein